LFDGSAWGKYGRLQGELERAMLLFGPYFTAVIPPFIANAVQKGRRLPAYVQGLFMQGLPYATLYTASKIAEILTH